MPNWFDNDELFKKQLAAGHQHAERAAGLLRQHGLHVEVTPMEVRAHIEDRGDFVDEHDLMVGVHRPCRVDVKSRDLMFTDDPASYPYPTALVDTVTGWEAKTHKPLAVMLLSQHPNGGTLVIPPSTRADWAKRARHDRVRQITDWFYEVPKTQLRPLATLVEWLQQRERTDPAPTPPRT